MARECYNCNAELSLMDNSTICGTCRTKEALERKNAQECVWEAEMIERVPLRYRTLARANRALAGAGDGTVRWWVGTSGSGKTCAMALHALEAVTNGNGIMWLTVGEIAKVIQADAMGEKSSLGSLGGLRKTHLLCIDDFGQANWTHSFAHAFHTLLEHRHGRMLHLAWTSQWGIADLRQRLMDSRDGMDPEQANAILRRMTYQDEAQ